MDVAEQAEVLGKVLLAAVCGGFIGWQRDRHQYVAGLRTMALVGMGAAMFTAITELFGDDRAVANVVTGIGFLGAGIIFRDGSNIRGITTAATIWAVAATGVLIGLELYLVALVGTVVIFVVLEMRPFSEYISGRREEPPPMPGPFNRRQERSEPNVDKEDTPPDPTTEN
jgi:putative Mg2+ transporter-C (MgtC) family protein